MSADTRPRPLLGQLLIERGSLDAPALKSARDRQLQSGGERLGMILVRLGLISEQTLLEVLAEQLGVGVLREPELSGRVPHVVEFHATHRIPYALASRMAFFACRPDPEGEVLVAARDVLDSTLIEYLQSYLCQRSAYRLHLVATRDLERMLAQVYRPREQAGGNEDLRKLAEDAPIVELVNGVLARATDMRASDIHFEPEEFGFVVRYRIDGRLHAAEQYSRERFDAVVSRIKLISGLDIAERRLPQDGRFSSRTAGVDTDVRVSVIPGVQGESLVLRLLPNMQGKRFSLDNLGIEQDHLALYKSWMAQPDGIVLVTGPTGSGKSTTLYATLVACDNEHERALTVEDPVEYQIPGVTQFQVHPEIGFTFPAALRSILRHDPDTIMIGEIRDVDTARIAVQAALTGHMVYSTLHTNDSATAFLRLADMGVEPFLVGATVRGVVAQRLVRRLCDACAVPMSGAGMVPESVKHTLNKFGVSLDAARFREPRGCEQCSHTGYRGRTAIYELFSATDALRAALTQATSSLQDLLRAAGPDFRSLREDGLLKAARGVTSLEEVFAITGPGEIGVDDTSTLAALPAGGSREPRESIAAAR
jgi:general secretion pathway protein E